MPSWSLILDANSMVELADEEFEQLLSGLIAVTVITWWFFAGSILPFLRTLILITSHLCAPYIIAK